MLFVIGLFMPGFGLSGLSGSKGTIQVNEKDTIRVRIASLSYFPVKWDKEANLRILEKHAREAASTGAQLVVTPEGALEGYVIDTLRKYMDRKIWDPQFHSIAEPLDGPYMMKVRQLAQELRVDIVLGFLERDGEVLYNSAAWIDMNGDVLHIHRKTQLWEPYFDPPFYHPGYEIKAFDTRFGRMGMLICFERQIPEVARTLALDGARLLIIPAFGSDGEWNTWMLQTRARDNEVPLIFTNPERTLIVSSDGDIITKKENKQGAGIVYASLDLAGEPHKRMTRRRTEPFAEQISEYLPGANQRMSRPSHIKVASVQMHSSHNLAENVEKICRHLEDCARKGIRVAVFPECATTGYFEKDIPEYSKEELKDAEQTIAKACIENKIYAVVGTPRFEDGKLYNVGLVIDDKGQSIFSQPKIHLIGKDKQWAQPGNRLGIFRIDDILCSIFICHDSRYPELVRLPVIKGARLVFYISCEGNITKEHEIEDSRAQMVARAEENNVYVINSNTPQRIDPLEGSHGKSAIINPSGVILQEASIFKEDVLIEVLDLSSASGGRAIRSLEADFMKEWWIKGLELIDVPE